MTCLAVSEGILRLFPQLALKFYWDKTCIFDIFDIEISFKITFKLHPSCPNQSFWWLCRRLTRSTLFDGSYQGQVWAIRLRWVWDSWYPSISCWSLWIGKSTCSCESTVPETAPATSTGIIQVHILKNWRCFSNQNYTRQAVCLGYGGCSFVPNDM